MKPWRTQVLLILQLLSLAQGLPTTVDERCQKLYPLQGERPWCWNTSRWQLWGWLFPLNLSPADHSRMAWEKPLEYYNPLFAWNTSSSFLLLLILKMQTATFAWAPLWAPVQLVPLSFWLLLSKTKSYYLWIPFAGHEQIQPDLCFNPS